MAKGHLDDGCLQRRYEAIGVYVMGFETESDGTMDDDAYVAGKFKDRGYPGVRPTQEVMSEVIQSNPGVTFAKSEPWMESSTSQADVIREQAMHISGGIEPEPNPLPLHEIRVRAWGEPDNIHHGLGLVTIEIANPPTHQAERILLGVLPKVLELFLNKNRDYGDDMDHFKLGAKGMFVDIWRKVGKLKRGLWDGKPLAGEQIPEIMMDLIGHLLLALLDPKTAPKD